MLGRLIVGAQTSQVAQNSLPSETSNLSPQSAADSR